MSRPRKPAPPKPIRVIDLFAGPGGLAEGFSSVMDGNGQRVFDIVLSAEKEPSAHRTLTLRAFVRQFPPGRLPDDYYRFCDGSIAIDDLAATHADEWAAACREAMLIELGTLSGNRAIDERLDELLGKRDVDPGRNFVVIGGPPCQAYSLVGRARNSGIRDYEPSRDHRHFLYREYIRILSRVGPAAFVMENVKGMLSSSVGGERIFEQILADLERPDDCRHRYQLLALSSEPGGNHSLLPLPRPRDFIVRAERHGIPQARHRVIVVGVREDLVEAAGLHALTSGLLPPDRETRTVRDVIGRLPKLRSGLSRNDDAVKWKRAFEDALADVGKAVGRTRADPVHREIAARVRALRNQSDGPSSLQRSSTRYTVRRTNDELMDFLQDARLGTLPNHETRGHMESDLGRYLFCALFGEVAKRSPKASEFPEALAPAHANWESGKFADRFRVQIGEAPATTVTSHISKDGHYFIHPDPLQCRSLTVREAARLQTFPDNYLFLGNRTEQFVQVGNAVPPFLAMRIAEALTALLRPREQRRSAARLHTAAAE